MYRMLVAAIMTAALAACASDAQRISTVTPAAQAARAGQPSPAVAASVPLAVLPNEAGSVKIAIIGDTGTGGQAQYDIAAILADVRQTFPFETVLMLGDNMYGGEGARDFARKFEQPYKPLLDAGVKFHASLGNHDEPAQRFYAPFNMNGRRYYSFTRGRVEFFALDSTYMTPAQVEWLEDALQDSDADWKIAFFHHPLYSSGEKHGSEMDLRVLIEPLFVKHGVDVVFAGHEHFYERVKPQMGVHYFTAGGSAKLRRGNLDDRSPLTAKGFDTDHSFMVAEIAGDELYFETISRARRVVDAGAILRPDVVASR
jgi:hypothetical protein